MFDVAVIVVSTPVRFMWGSEEERLFIGERIVCISNYFDSRVQSCKQMGAVLPYCAFVAKITIVLFVDEDYVTPLRSCRNS